MGTNFYRRNIPTEQDIEKMHRLVDERKFTGYDDEYDSSLGSMVEHFSSYGVHIGKRSCGWQFSFDHNDGKYYAPSRESINEFLSEPYTEIIDEYGDTMTVEEFWEMVDEWNADPENAFTSKSYREYCRKRGESEDWILESHIKNVKELFGIDADDNDFTVDGLRFPVYTDFS